LKMENLTKRRIRTNTGRNLAGKTHVGVVIVCKKPLYQEKKKGL
jgi:hypothetical protein